MYRLPKFRPVLGVLLTVVVCVALLIGTTIRSSISSNAPTATSWLQAVQAVQGPDDEEEQVEQVEGEAELILKAPTKAQVGELVQFDLSESIAQSFKWILVPESIDFVVYEGGRKAAFSARKPGVYKFFVLCGYDGTCDGVIHIVTIERAAPPDPVVPDPNTVKPNTHAALNEWVVYWCTVNKTTKTEATRLAVSFESVAAQIDAGVLQRADSIITTTARANRAALGDSVTQWLPVLESLQTTMKSLANRGLLSTPDQHQALWLIIAEGLHTYAAQ